MAPSFQNTTWLQLQNEVSLRLNDPNQVRWIKAEIIFYLSEALRLWQVLTQQYITEWTTTYTQPNPATLPVWQSTGNSWTPTVGSNPSSPRTQTLTDSYVYTIIQYHLLEPPNGDSAWTGTTQFSLQDFINSFTRRRDQILQLTDCNVGPFPPAGPPLSIVPNTNRVQIPDSTSQSVLDVRRVRYLPTSGNPATLYRDDLMAMEYFDNQFLQTNNQPLTWDVLGSPQQFLTFDTLVNVPNTLDCLGILSNGTVLPVGSLPLLIPDDFFWVLKYGMMADMLSKETESKDLLRAQYCEQRFSEGIRVMMELPWLMQGRINNIPVDTPSFYEADQFDYEWQSNPNAMNQIIRGGIDLFAISPLIPATTPNTSVSILLSLVANAVIPATDGAFVQLSREILDVIVDEAEHLAQFKEGGAEMQESIALHQRFIKMAVETNQRLKMSGIFATDLRRLIGKEDESQPRFAQEKEPTNA